MSPGTNKKPVVIVEPFDHEANGFSDNAPIADLIPWERAAWAYARGHVQAAVDAISPSFLGGHPIEAKPGWIEGIVRERLLETHGMPSPVGGAAVYKKQPIPPRLRWDVFARDDFTCKHCGSKGSGDSMLHADHVVPESKGGPTTIENLQTLCGSCNSRKGARTPS